MEVFMKTKVLLKAAIAGVVLLLALSFVTCELDLLGGKGGGEDNLDWEFVDNPDGTAQLTVWLDGSKPVKAATANRALNLGIAKRSHDFFEAVFVIDDVVARSNWEIGQAAGIRGVPRGKTYYSVTTGTNAADGNSLVLVGRKVGNGEGTLLGVGYMTHVNGTAITSAATGTVATNTRNVTFTVSPVTTKIGYDFSILDTQSSWDEDYEPIRDTFLTAAKVPSNSIGDVSFDNTLIGTATFKEIATYTMFGLPEFASPGTNIAASGDPEDYVNQVAAVYKMDGFSLSATEAALTGASIYNAALDLGSFLYVADCTPAPSFQILERLAMYQALGQTHDVIEAPLDTVTTVHAGGSYAPALGDTFNPVIPLEFRIRAQSGGAFAFTFQIPVFAFAPDSDGYPAPSTNGGPEGIYWYIRPAHGQQQFLLDDGRSSGGAVLMGVGVGSLDWLEIIVDGFGFSGANKRPPTP
jgi:hypothetical protein